MWSGPRNLSTALMRSFESRNDTIVWDEPLYAYYLKETKKKHPLKEEIINTYETDINKLILSMIKKNKNNKIFYQKHMTHHILDKTPIDWINNGINCFLIRDPRDVMISYIKKNEIENKNDLGFHKQIDIFNFIKKSFAHPIVINADDLSNKPKIVLKKLCEKIKIPFSEKMLSWKKGKRESDGIWEKIWYKNVQSSSKFEKLEKKDLIIPKKHLSIYQQCLTIYNEINNYNILNGK
tara:strand:- start:495 stop:1205 length:711 start_codon:yes stop_codon:yes gene_type:complete